jgi:2'-5' RNA ligase
MSGFCSGGGTDVFALVAYLPEPLADFVHRVRRELSPGCRLRAHITILPPRPLTCSVDIASRELQAALGRSHSFRIELEQVKRFPVSDVVYVSIGAGVRQLKELHTELNHGPCQSRELWGFEPHVTLGQDLDSVTVPAALELAQRRWREYNGPRHFALDKLTFVQGTAENEWADLSTWELPSPVLV